MKKATAKQVRYAVVGLGHIAQVAVLPAFEHAKKNSKLVAFVSGDTKKVKELAKQFKVENSWSYEEYDECLKSGEIDAVYIALPNSMHKDFAIRAAEAGIHVLCEKPMAASTSECQAMIAAAEKNDIRLMIAYRLHFEEANMRAVTEIHNGVIGEVRLINSTFTMQVKADNIRTEDVKAAGPLFDIGIYCINAARYLMRSEPLSVIAMSVSRDQKRFSKINEAVSVSMKFSEERLASFVCSFGAKDVSRNEIVGTSGRIILEPAYDYSVPLKIVIETDDRLIKHQYPRRDQFAAELLSFSDCVLNGREPEPSGVEGLADVRIIEAILKSAETGKEIKLGKVKKTKRPTEKQVTVHPPVRKTKLIKVESASRK